MQYSKGDYFVLQGSFTTTSYIVLQGSDVIVIRSQLLKGFLDGCILAVIEERTVYGYELSQRLNEIGLIDVSEGTIYPVLLRLQKNHYIVGEMKPSPSGPSRKYYVLTDEGHEALQLIREEWQKIQAPIAKLLGGTTNE